MFEEVFENLDSLGRSNYSEPIRVWWEMQRSPTRCAPFVYPEVAEEVTDALLPRVVASDAQKEIGGGVV